MKNKFSIAMSLAVILAMLLTSLALADDVSNNIDGNIDATLESISLTAGGANGSVGLYIQPRNGDGDNGCNIQGSETLVVSVNSSNTSVATVSPASITFGACGDIPSLTVTPVGTGSATISLSQTSNNTGGTFNLAPASFTVNVGAPTPTDSTPPVIGFIVSGTLGNNGWYVTDVFVDWTVADPDSSLTINEGCVDTTIATDTSGATLTCSATSAGGTSSESVTIKRDASAPSVSATPDPAANANGWNNTDVNVSYTCADNGPSGVDAAASDLADDLLTATGTASGTCVDLAGNSAGASYSAQIDKVKPVISGSRTPAANANGWNNTDVVVSFSCTDSGGSGLDTNTVAGATVSTEGTSQSVTNTGSCTDKAGNTADSVTISGINIDKTLPIASASASPAANANGWNNTNVTVTFSGNDGTGSGIDSCDAAVVLSSEGTNQSASGTCTDKAGNVSASAAASGINIDKTAPTGLSFVGGPAAGGNYYFGSVPAAPGCTADGAISGLASCAVTGYSAAVGPHTMTATATDNAGNHATATQSYTVLAWTLNGFYQPVDMNGIFNTVRGGSTVPLKFEVFAGSTELTSTSAIASFVQTRIACDGSAPQDDIEITTTGGTSLRYDTTAGQFIQNWQTPRQAGACYRVTMTTQDGSALVAFFKLK